MARRQLVCALQVHVAVGGADRSLAVYNALRPWLPAIAALAANAPYHDGRDTGMASIRPKISELLPRQGIPPAISSWDAFADALRWGVASGAMPVPGRWWWELRPHPAYGTLEVRVPDAQATVADAAAVTALVVCLVAWLAERHDGRRARVVARLVAAGREPLVRRALGARRRARRPGDGRPHARARDPGRAAGDARPGRGADWAAPPSWRACAR